MAPQPVEGRCDRLVVAHLGQFRDQLKRCLLDNGAASPSGVAGDAKLCMNATLPVEAQNMTALVSVIRDHDLAKHRAQDALLEYVRRLRVTPQRRKIVTKVLQSISLNICELFLGTLDLELLLELPDSLEGVVPARF